MNKTYFKTQNIAFAKQALCGKKRLRKRKNMILKMWIRISYLL